MNTQAAFCFCDKVESNRPKASASIGTQVINQALTPWHCHPHDGVSVIEGYSASNGKRHIIAQIFSSPGINAEATAEMIVNAVNDQSKTQELMKEIISTLELCIESGGLSWEAEQQADKAHRKVGQLLSGERPKCRIHRVVS